LTYSSITANKKKKKLKKLKELKFKILLKCPKGKERMYKSVKPLAIIIVKKKKKNHKMQKYVGMEVPTCSC
jgi:hypothetical protein